MSRLTFFSKVFGIIADLFTPRSRTLFWKFVPDNKPGNSKFYAGGSKSGGFTTCGHEWHRGIADDAILEQGSADEPIHVPLPEVGSSRRWPFALQVPAQMVSTECSDMIDRSGFRSASYNFSRIPRPPPPTLRNNRNASIEWVVEATLRLVDLSQGLDNPDLGEGPSSQGTSNDLPPAFGDLTSTAVTDDRGFALSAPPSLLISRAVLPLVPANDHLVALETLPMFGQAPSKRTETGGAELIDVAAGVDPDFEEEAVGRERLNGTENGVTSIPTNLERITTSGGTGRQVWHKEVPVGGPLGINKGSIVSQVLVPLSLIVSRKTASFRLQLRLSFVPAQSTLSKLSGKSKQSPERGRPVPLEKISVRIASRTLTRGGGRTTPYMLLKEVQKHDLVSQEITEGIPMTAEGDAKWIDVDVDLQSTATLPSTYRGKDSTQPNIPCAGVPPSFRTPNVEYEVRRPACLGDAVF